VLSDTRDVDSRGQTGSKRQIGSIFVERGHISEEQLALALTDQQASGEKLGEILVANYGLSRLDLASALEEQWAEDEHGNIPNHSNGSPPGGTPRESLAARLPPEIQAVLSQLGDALALGAALKQTTENLDSRSNGRQAEHHTRGSPAPASRTRSTSQTTSDLVSR